MAIEIIFARVHGSAQTQPRYAWLACLSRPSWRRSTSSTTCCRWTWSPAGRVRRVTPTRPGSRRSRRLVAPTNAG